MKKIIMEVGLGIIFVMLVGVFQVRAEEPLHIVTYNRIDGGSKPVSQFESRGVDLKATYGIIEHHYFPPGEDALEYMKKRYMKKMTAKRKKVDLSIEDWKSKYKDEYKPVDESFIDNLSKAKFLHFGQYCFRYSYYLFNKPKYANAISEFLKKGGTIYFDYNATSLALTQYLDSINVKNPASGDSDTTCSGSYGATDVSSEYKNHPLVNHPHKITSGGRGYNWFWKNNCSKEQILLFTVSGDSREVAMVVQENVLGKGTIIFTQLSPIFRNRYKKLLENILSFAYGQDIREYKMRLVEEAGGPGVMAE